METKLHKISDYLLLKSSFSKDISLFHGKMGIVLSLYLYASQHDDELLKEYAWDLFLQVHDSVHTDMPIGLEYGLAGIGVGTVLLCHHGGIDCDFNDILSDVDAKIMERDPRRMKDLSLRTGVAGLWYYLRLRETLGNGIKSFDRQYINELHLVYDESRMTGDVPNIMEMVNEPFFALDDYIEKPLGIDNGCSYYILKSVIG